MRRFPGSQYGREPGTFLLQDDGGLLFVKMEDVGVTGNVQPTVAEAIGDELELEPGDADRPIVVHISRRDASDVARINLQRKRTKVFATR